MNTSFTLVIGNVVRDPEIRKTATGKDVAEFTVAVNRSGNGDHGGADFYRCQAWSKTAEIVEQYVVKGRKVCVTGRMKSRKYKGSDGLEREVWDLIANTVEMLDRPRDESAPERVAPVTVPAPAEEYDPYGDE